MPEDEWWRRYIRTLLELPETSDDPVALTDLLFIAGFYKTRTGIARPSWLPPERAARSAWNLRYATTPRFSATPSAGAPA